MRQPIALETTAKIKAAFTRARLRIGGFSGGITLAAILVLLSFVLLAVLAPIAIKMPRFFQGFLGYLPFLALMAGIYVAVSVLLKLSKSNAPNAEVADFSGTIAKTAFEDAMNVVEDAGLKAKTLREYQDCISGRVGDTPIAVFAIGTGIFAVLRLKAGLDCFVMLAPNHEKWPFEYENKQALAPISINPELDAKAWSLDNLSARDKAQGFALKLEPALKMSKIGGQTPFLFAKDRSIALHWRTGDIGTCALIAYEIAKSII